jgi:hypothetical protein
MILKNDLLNKCIAQPIHVSRLLKTYQGPICIAIPIRIDIKKLTYCERACPARRFDFDKSGEYYGVLRRISGRI